MRNQYKILAEKYSLVKEDGKEDILAGLNYLTSDIITSTDQTEPGMTHITELLLKKLHGKVERVLLNWIRDNFLNVFDWNDNEFEQLTGTIDEMFDEVAMVRWENTDSDEDSDEGFKRQENQVLNILIQSYKKNSKRTHDFEY
jgi:hypothetical protein